VAARAASRRESVSTIASASYSVTPYHAHVPTFGDWGFVLARRGDAPTAKVPLNAPRLRFLDQRVLDAASVFSDDVAPRTLEPLPLEHPRVVDDMRQGYD
jgi:spermidine synthase